MKANNNNLMKNDSGNNDPTAGEAIKSVLKHTKTRDEEIYKMIKTVKKMLNVVDLELIGRVHIKDTRTGKKYY